LTSPGLAASSVGHGEALAKHNFRLMEQAGNRLTPFGGFWALLAGGVLLGAWDFAGFHALLVGAAGLLVLAFPPTVALPRWWWWLAGLFVVAGAAPLLPAGWFGLPQWRERLAGLGVNTGKLVAIQWRQVVEMLGIFAITLVTGLWLAGHRASPSRLRVWTLAFTLGVAGYALLARVMQAPPVSDQPGGGVLYGFFPNRNHTGTYLAMGVICGLGCVLQAVRDRRPGRVAVALAGTGLCLWAVAGWSISRGGLLLVGAGILAWLPLSGFRLLGKSVRRVLVVLALAVAGLAIAAETAAMRRLARTVEQVEQLVTEGEAPPQVGSTARVEGVVDLDFRIPIVMDTLRMVRDFRWTGIGAGQFYYVFPQYRKFSVTRNNADCHHPDNDWLWLLVETGPVATLALAALVALALRQSLRGIPAGGDRALRAACLVAALVVPVHGLFDVPGHRLALAWSAALLYSLSLGPGGGGQGPRKVVAWPFRAAGAAMLATAAMLAWARWWGGPQPAVMAGQIAADRALALYHQDQARLQAALARGETYEPPADRDPLEQALALLAETSAVVPLDREIPRLTGQLALQFDDRLALAERAFAIERELDPTWVTVLLDQAVALGAVAPERTRELWAEAIRRAERVDRIKAGTVWGRDYTMETLTHRSRVNPGLRPFLPQPQRGP
jgi:O-antigen ligase